MSIRIQAIQRRMFGKRMMAVLAPFSVEALVPSAWAADPAYPARPIKFVVPFAAGSTADIVARLFGERLGSRLGQPVIVENWSGAGGVIGVDFVAKAPADGHTLLLTTSSTLVINPSLYKKLPHNVDRDLTSVAMLGSLPAILVATPSLPVNSVAELVSYVRRAQGKLSYASNGVGSYAHVMMELLKHSTGMEIEHVPYRGGSSADTDLLAGNVHLMFNSLAAASPLVAAGRLKALAVSSARRSSLSPSVPGMDESGLPELKDYDVTYWVGIMAPSATPPAVIRALNAEVNAWIETTEAKEKLAARKILTSSPTAPEDMAKLIRAETVSWAKVLREAKVELQSV